MTKLWFIPIGAAKDERGDLRPKRGHVLARGERSFEAVNLSDAAGYCGDGMIREAVESDLPGALAILPAVGIDLNRTARLIHEALSKTAQALGQEPYPPWETAEDWHKKNSMDTARTIYAIPTVATGGIIWRAWASWRLVDGWTHAEVTDKSAKKHAMLPRDGESMDAAFARLPWAEQLKDYVAFGVALDDLRAQGAF
jgi:hypothetical protein